MEFHSAFSHSVDGGGAGSIEFLTDGLLGGISGLGEFVFFAPD